ncbi:Ff.00g078140.m01.CDS01 [Fusarium sp. VM40]|nr:Ff.00g078140.m01.CDS01 [Fusarium sp. VM40]
MNSSMSPTWWLFCVTLFMCTTPIFARFIDYPLQTKAVARQAATADAPAITERREFRIEARSAESIPTYTITYAPDSVCGYLSGTAEIPITCENKNICLWELEYFKFIACELKGETTGIARTTCLAKDKALNASLCQDNCISNTYNLLCTNDTAPFCRTYAYPSGVFDYRCDSTPAGRNFSVDFTFSGQKHPKWVLSTIADGDTAIQSTTPSSTTDSTSSTSSTGEQAATSSASTDPKEKKGLSSGAIAGIAIAGVVIAALAVGFFLWRRRTPTPIPQGSDAQMGLVPPRDGQNLQRPVSPPNQQPEGVRGLRG